MAFEAVIELARASVIPCFRVLNIFCHFRVSPQTGKKYCCHQKTWNPDVFLNLIYKFLGKWCMYHKSYAKKQHRESGYIRSRPLTIERRRHNVC